MLSIIRFDIASSSWEVVKDKPVKIITLYGYKVALFWEYTTSPHIPRGLFAYDIDSGVCITHLTSCVGSTTMAHAEQYTKRIIGMYGGSSKIFKDLLKLRANGCNVVHTNNINFITMKLWGIIK